MKQGHTGMLLLAGLVGGLMLGTGHTGGGIVIMGAAGLAAWLARFGVLPRHPA